MKVLSIVDSCIILNFLMKGEAFHKKKEANKINKQFGTFSMEYSEEDIKN